MAVEAATSHDPARRAESVRSWQTNATRLTWLLMAVGVLAAVLITAELVEAVLGLRCIIIDDPIPHTPLVIPRGAYSLSDDLKGG